MLSWSGEQPSRPLEPVARVRQRLSSVRAALTDWREFPLLAGPSGLARTGEAGGHRYQSWGPLLALIAVEEYIDLTPWEGFRFGILQPDKKGEILRIAIQGRHYDIKVSPGETRMKEEGRDIIKANGGMVFRHFLYSENEVSFESTALVPRKIKIRFLTKGKYQFFLDEVQKRIFSGDSVEIKIPEGNHAVMILLIEKQR